MNLIHILPRFLPTIGGLESHVFLISRELARRGHSVRVFTSDDIGQGRRIKKKHEVIEGIDVHRFSPLYIRRNDSMGMLLPSMLREIAVDKTAEVIHVFSMFSLNTIFSIFCARARTFRRVCLVFTPLFRPLSTMTQNNNQAPINLKLYYYLTLHASRLADKIIASTHHEFNHLRTLGIRSDKLEIIPPPIDWEKFSIIRDGTFFRKKRSLHKNVVLSVARSAPGKGLETLLKAAPIVLSTVPDTSFVIIGQDWGFRGYLEKLSKTLNAGDNVVLTGLVPYEELLQAYAAADIVVLSSRSEGFGIVILEAAACGKPVIATKWTGLQDMLRYANVGVLFNYGDENQLASNIIGLLLDRKQREKMGKRGRELVEKEFTSHIIANKIESLYDSICADA